MVPTTSRRRFLAATAVGVATGVAGCSSWSSIGDPGTSGSTSAIADLPDAVGLETIVGGLQMPVAVAFAPDADRRYVVERDGRVFVHESDGLLEEPFVDLRDAVVTGGERGLLGIALHPDFAENRRLFLQYSTQRREGTPAEYDHTTVLAEFEATDDGVRATPKSERAVLEIPQPSDFHNGGDLAFGPDGYLYVSVGAGGGGEGGGQDVTTDFLGSILRIDVDERADDQEYAVPDDNPLVGREGLDEYYAWGFRNPWRLSFDGDDFYVADVGESSYEEVNLVEKGGNYGWNVREGTHCLNADDCPDETPEDVRGGEPLLDPIIEYPHSDAAVSGVAVIGGYVYRGSDLPALEGAYVFGDLQAAGRLFAASRPDDDGLWPTTVVELPDDGANLEQILAFGRDGDGEVYVLGVGEDGGGLFRIVPVA